MIVYQMEQPGYGWLTYREFDEVVEEIKNEIEAYNLFPGEVTFTVKLVEMSEDELADLPATEA